MIPLIIHDSRARSQWGRYNLPRYILIIYPFAYPVSKSLALFFSVSCKSTNLASYMAPVFWACACASCPHPGSVRFFENASIGRILSIIICGYYKLQPYIYIYTYIHPYVLLLYTVSITHDAISHSEKTWLCHTTTGLSDSWYQHGGDFLHRLIRQ